MSVVERGEWGLRIRQACPASVEALVTAVGPDGVWWVVSAGGGQVRWWPVDGEPGDGRVVHRVPPTWESVPWLGVAGAPGGGRMVVARSLPYRLSRWDLDSGRPLGATVRHWRPWMLDRGAVLLLEEDGGPVLLTGMLNGALQRWELATGQPVGPPWPAHEQPVWSLALVTSADGDRVIVSGGGDRLVRRWRLDGTEYGPPISGCGVATTIAAVTLPEGRVVLCVGSARGRVHRRDLRDGQPLGNPIDTGWRPSPYRRGCLMRLAVVATDSGAVVATCVDESRVSLWDLVSGQPIGAGIDADGGVCRLAGARLGDGTPVLLIGGRDGRVRRFDARTGHPIGAPMWVHGKAASLIRPVPLPDGRVILLAMVDYSTRRFDAGTGQPLDEQPLSGGLGAYGAAVVGLPGGRTLLALGGDDGVDRLEVASGTSWPRLVGDTTFWDVAALELPDGQVVLVGAGDDRLVHRWDAVSGQPLTALAGHQTSVKAVAVGPGPDGYPMIVSGDDGGQVRRWHAGNGTSYGEPLLSTADEIRDLVVFGCRDGRAILLANCWRHDLDEGNGGCVLLRWDLGTDQPLGQPTVVVGLQYLIAAHLDPQGVPHVFLLVDDDAAEDGRVMWWRADTGTTVDVALPRSFRAVFNDDQNRTMMVLAEPDGSITVTTLPTA